MISTELIAQVRRCLENQIVDHARVAQQLRAAFPGVMFSVCNDNDIPSRIKSLGGGAGFALYGIHTGGHCATLVSELEAANGLAIALIDEDD